MFPSLAAVTAAVVGMLASPPSPSGGPIPDTGIDIQEASARRTPVKVLGATGAEEVRIARLADEVLTSVEQVRGLKMRGTLSLGVLSDAAFDDAWSQLVDARMIKGRSDIPTLYAAFGLLPAGSAAATAPPQRADPSLLGFYDPKRKQLFVRNHIEGATHGKGDQAIRQVLAHEIAHALQDVNFGLQDLTAIRSHDEMLALKALYEGDAMFTEEAYWARRAALPVKRTVGKLADLQRMVVETGLLRSQAAGDPEALPPVLLDALLFQYVSGFAFVADLERAGSMRAVDRAFQHPARSTSQVLHPARYGEEKVPASLAAPSARGADTVAAGQLGELAVRALLRGCVGTTDTGAELASHLVADAYTLVRRPNGRAGVLWVSRWSNHSARTVAAALESSAACLTGGEMLPRVAVVGDLIGYVRGVEGVDPRDLAGSSEPGSTATSALRPPLGGAGLASSDGRPFVAGDFIHSPRLGLVGPADMGYSINDDLSDREYEMRLPLGEGSLSVWLVSKPLTAEAQAAFFGEVVVRHSKGMSGMLANEIEGQVLGAWRRAVVASFTRDDQTGFNVRTVVVPICEGKAFFAIETVFRTSRAESELGKWLTRARFSEERPTACAELASKR